MRHATILVAILLVGASLLGCVAPAMPPHMSFSRHLAPFENEAEEAQTARIGMTTGAVILSRPEEGSLLALFPSEGFLAFFEKHYSGSFAAAPPMPLSPMNSAQGRSPNGSLTMI